MNVVKFKKEKQDKMKGLGKALYILARIGKIMVTICIPIVIATMIIIGCLINLVEVKNGTITVKGCDDVITVEEENVGNEQKVSVKMNHMEIPHLP